MPASTIPYRTPLLSPELQRQLNAEISDGERIVWSTQPMPGLYGRSSLGIVLLGIPFTAFAIFWMVGAGWITSQPPAPIPGPFRFFPLFGLPFLLIGFGMLSSPLWIGRMARRTVYAVTDRRVITIEGRPFGRTRVRSFLPDRLTSMTRNQRADGSGDLIFEEFRERRGTGTTTVRRGFFAIPDVQGVQELITRTLLTGRTRAV